MCLQGIRLQGISLQGVSLQGVSLQGVRLQGVSLQGGCWSRSPPGREFALVSARVEAHVAAPFVARERRARVPGAAPPTKSRVAANQEEKGKG